MYVFYYWEWWLDCFRIRPASYSRLFLKRNEACWMVPGTVDPVDD